MKMAAKKAGTCKVCAGVINVGDKIKWYRGWGAKHEGCNGDIAGGDNGNERKTSAKAALVPSGLPNDERKELLALLEEAALVTSAFTSLCADEDKAKNTCRRAEDLQGKISEACKRLSSFARKEEED